MPEITVSEKVLAFAKEFMEKVNTQDNRCTATPFYYTLRNPNRVPGVSSDCSDGHVWYHLDDCETEDSDEDLIESQIVLLIEAMEEIAGRDYTEDNIEDLCTDHKIVSILYGDLDIISGVISLIPEESSNFKTLAEEILTLCPFDIKQLAEKLGYEQRYYRNGYTYENVFFTEDAAKIHLEQNKHRYNDGADTYVEHSLRNPELRKMMEAIAAIAGVTYERK